VGGNNAKVSPSVVRVVGEEILGRVTVLVPMMRIPELEMTVCPSGSTVVNGETPLEEVVDGKNVNVSPSVTRVVGSVTLGIVIVSLPPIIRSEERETTTCPSGSVQVVALPVRIEEDGNKVKVSPSVVNVVAAETGEIGIVKLPLIISIDEEETTVAPSGSVQVVAGKEVPALVVLKPLRGEVLWVLVVLKPLGREVLWVLVVLNPEGRLELDEEVLEVVVSTVHDSTKVTVTNTVLT